VERLIASLQHVFPAPQPASLMPIIDVSLARAWNDAGNDVGIDIYDFPAYIALQFLRASLAAINGLGRKSYSHIEAKEIAPRPKEKKEAYLQRACTQMAQVLAFNREVINKKVDQLELGHEAIKNAVWGPLLLLLVILVIVAVGAQP